MIKTGWFYAFLVLVLASLACNISFSSGAESGLQATQMALAVQQTSVALQQATLNSGTSASGVAATYTPYPTYTAEAALVIPQATATEAADIADLIKSSNVLIYEDVVGDPTLVPIVTNTVNSMGFSGGKVVNVGDALGRFRDQVNSATDWDLIIVSAEVRSSFSGELFEMLYEPIENGAAVIIELWYLDDVSEGKIAPILSDCGVRLFRDWQRSAGYDPYKYSIYWLENDHPLLSAPNVVVAPSYPYPEWFGDAGDLLELGPGGDAVLVGGLFPNRNSDYGVLASCMSGRLIIQTFSSHDYDSEVIQPLWENYITYTLTRHYETTR